MDEPRWERWGAASGFGALVAGAVGGALERGWPSATDPVAVASFIAENRSAILARSMFFPGLVRLHSVSDRDAARLVSAWVANVG